MLIIAMIHLNNGTITLNDHSPYDARFNTLRAEIKQFQAVGVKVLGCMGGAISGSFNNALQHHWPVYYPLLREFIMNYSLDGFDLNIEESFEHATVVRLINELKGESHAGNFRPNFLVTMAPVARNLKQPQRPPGNSELDYVKLERELGSNVNWYNPQFYNGHGTIHPTKDYNDIVSNGFAANKVVALLSTHPSTFPHHPEPHLTNYLKALKEKQPNLGGVAGWEYFRATVAGTDEGKPWVWMKTVSVAVN